jgi:peptidase C80-like protein
VQELSDKWKRGPEKNDRKKDVAVVDFVKTAEESLEKQGQDSPSKKALLDAIKALPKNSRVYIVGHGDAKPDEVGGWKHDEVAKLLKECNLTEDQTGVISIVACKAALGPLKQAPEEDRTEGKFSTSHWEDDALDNFAAKFHHALGTGDKPVRCKVFGRVFNLQVVTEKHLRNQFKGKLDTRKNEVLGRKITRNQTFAKLPDPENPDAPAKDKLIRPQVAGIKGVPLLQTNRIKARIYLGQRCTTSRMGEVSERKCGRFLGYDATVAM